MPALSRRGLLRLAGGTAAGGALAATAPGLSSAARADTFELRPLPEDGPEPDLAAALRWWPPQRNVWTPIGWKGHLFRFTSVYNGALICEPSWVISAKPNVMPYQGRNFQFTVVMPQRVGGFRSFPDSEREVWDDDLGYRKQGWQEDHDAPVLWTEFRRPERLVVRQSVFAHLPGAGEVQTAVEPLYAWVRFEVTHVDPVEPPDEFAFRLWLSKAYMRPQGPYEQENGVPLRTVPALAPLDGGLTMQRVWNPDLRPVDVPILDDDGNVRLMVRTAEGGRITLAPNDAEGVYDLDLSLPAEVGSHIDLLVPLLPGARADVEEEFTLGWEGALAESDGFWAPDGQGARITTPDHHVNQVLRRGPQLAEIVAEKSPDLGLFSFLSGSYAYDVLWSTPTSMISHMFLDRLGRHDVVEKHIEIYKEYQGTRTPPGAVFAGGSYPGYLSTPQELQAIDWMSDHGAILEIISTHALLSGRREFVDRWLEPVVMACEYIAQAVALTGHDGVPGLMPPGHSTDEGVETQGMISQCFTYKGLASAVRLLKREKHPRAAEFAALADTFRTTYVQAMRDLGDRSATWTDADGNSWPVLRPQFTGTGVWDDFTMLDTGALMSVWAGLMPASDPLMSSFVEFFRVGPNTALFDPVHHNALYPAVLDHEQSSSEPCYSWNLFHSWQLGDRQRYLEGMFGLVAGGLSQDTYISSEHRNAIYGNLFSYPIVVWTILHAVIDDSLEDELLHLLRLCPLSWISSDTRTRFEQVATQYGPVDLEFGLAEDGRTLDVAVTGHWHHAPRRTILHLPPLPDVRTVVVNGRRYAARETIVLDV